MSASNNASLSPNGMSRAGAIRFVFGILEAPAQDCEKQLLVQSGLSVRPSAWNNSAPTDTIFIEFDI